MDHNLTEYRVTVTGDRCGRTRTYTVRSAWMDVVVAAAIAGPVVIAEPSVSTFVPAGWTAELDKQGAIWLRHGA